MKKIICLYNHAGGVGKTTAAAAIASLLAARGLRTLAVDLDSQANLTQFLSAKRPGDSIEQALRGGPLPLIDLQPYLCLAPASPGLITVENELRNDQNARALQNVLSETRDDFDFVVIDTPPSTDYLAINALSAADFLLVPVLPDGKSLAGLDQVRIACKASSSTTTIDGIFLSNYNSRRCLDAFIDEELRKRHAGLVFETRIRQCISLRECALHGCDIISYAPRSSAAQDYKSLVDELIQRLA